MMMTFTRAIFYSALFQDSHSAINTPPRSSQEDASSNLRGWRASGVENETPASISTRKLQEKPYCLRVKTGSESDNEGYLYLDVATSKCHYKIPNRFYKQGETLVKCYESQILSVDVQNAKSEDAWAGTIEISSQSGANYAYGRCANCTPPPAGNDTPRIAVDGNDDWDTPAARCSNKKKCTIEPDCQKGHCKGSDYDGQTSVTVSGRTCQKWALDTPHKHSHGFETLPNNYCRNPDGEAGVWCYTTDPDKRWELCNVPKCRGCQNGPTKGSDYDGYASVTVSGRTCQKWALDTPHKQTHGFETLPNNYCRNPDGEPGLWCYTTDPDKRWELCNVPKCQG